MLMYGQPSSNLIFFWCLDLTKLQIFNKVNLNLNVWFSTSLLFVGTFYFESLIGMHIMANFTGA